VKVRLAAAAIVILGSLLLLSRLGTQSLWGDEAVTLVPVTRAHDVHDLFARVRSLDTQPPGAHLLIYALQPFLPADERGFRLPSLLEAALAAGLIAALAYRLAGPMAAVVGAAASIASPFLAFYAMEARNYALWLLFSLAALYAIVRWNDARGGERGGGRTWSWAALWCAANICGLLTHAFHVFAIASQGVLVLALVVRNPPSRSLFPRAAASAAAALIGPFAVLSAWLVRFYAASAVARGVGWTRPLRPAALAYYPFAFVFGFSYGPDLRELHEATIGTLVRAHPVALLAAAAGITVLFASLAALLRGRNRTVAAFFLLAPLAGVAGPLLYSAVTGFPLVPRHLIFVWPVVPLLEAAAFARLPRFRPALLAVFLLQAIALSSLLFDPAYGKDDERAAVAHAEENSGDRAYVLGDVAPIYARRTTGLLKAQTDPSRDGVFEAGTTDLWLVDNRAWEDPDGRYRAKMERAAARLGLAPGVEDGRYSGIVLWHWRRP
jgi:hypothetical protein